MPDKLTITEALAEIKTIVARVDKKRKGIENYVVRDARLKDPMSDEGGSTEWVRRERQAVKDLMQRMVSIRGAIQATNRATTVTVNGTSRTVVDWLNWKKEVAPNDRAFLSSLSNMIGKARNQAKANNMAVVEGQDGKAGELVVALSEANLVAEIEEMETTLGELDGKLSLVNATTFIEV